MGENREEGHMSQARGGKGKVELLLPGAERGWTRLHLFDGPQRKKSENSLHPLKINIHTIMH